MAKNTKTENVQLNLKRAIIYIVCTFLVIMSIFPFWLTFINATRGSFDIQQGFSFIPSNKLMQNYKTLLERGSFDVWVGMRNSLIISTCSTILTVYFSALTAYGLTVYTFRFKYAAFNTVLAVLMIPTQVSAVGFFQLMYQFGMSNTFIPLIIPAIAAPSSVFFLCQYMKTALPLEIVDAARIDGSHEFATFNRIALPLIKPGIAIQAIFAFIASWNNFFTPSMIISSKDKYTLPMIVQILKSDRFRTDYGLVYLGVAMSMLPLIIVYACLSKYIIGGVALGGVKE